MSKRNRKFMYDQLVSQGRVKDIVPRLIEEFGNPKNKEEVAEKAEEADKEIAKAEEAKKYTKTQLMAMNRDKQTEILKLLGVTAIPRTEADRVDKILERSA